METNIKNYTIITGTPSSVEFQVKQMLEKNWFIKGDLIPTTSSEGTPIVLQNMVHYGDGA